MNLLFFDIDGTLARGRDVPASARDTLLKSRQKGNKVFLCTGRALGYVKLYFGEIADGFICSNGRFGILDDEVLYDHPLTDKQVKDIINDMEHCHASYCFFGQQGAYYVGQDEGYQKMAKHWPEGFIQRGLPAEKESFYNFDIDFKDEAHFAKIKAYCANKYLFNPHFPDYSADTTILGYDKGTALKAIAKVLKVPLANTYAFGDGDNDVSMLQEAGTGIAMGNGSKAALAAADYITAPIDADGIAKALEHLKLV